MTTDINKKIIDLTDNQLNRPSITQNHQPITNIYPGIIPNSNIPRTQSPTTFIDCFPLIIQHAKSNNIERYLNDIKYNLITPKRELQSLISNIRDKAAHSYYASLQNQKKQEITDNILFI